LAREFDGTSENAPEIIMPKIVLDYPKKGKTVVFKNAPSVAAMGRFVQDQRN
jgi:hypothetical protein